MERTFTPYSQLVAYFDYDKALELLFITLKNGAVYKVESFPYYRFLVLKKERNKGAYIYHNVFKNPLYTITKTAQRSAKEIDIEVQSHYYKRNYVIKNNAEGWDNYLAK